MPTIDAAPDVPGSAGTTGNAHDIEEQDMGNIGQPRRRIEVLPETAPAPSTTPAPERTAPAAPAAAEPRKPVRQ